MRGRTHECHVAEKQRNKACEDMKLTHPKKLCTIDKFDKTRLEETKCQMNNKQNQRDSQCSTHEKQQENDLLREKSSYIREKRANLPLPLKKTQSLTEEHLFIMP